MVEVIGDVVIPSELILPSVSGAFNAPTRSGALWVSGANLYWAVGDTIKYVSGAVIG